MTVASSRGHLAEQVMLSHRAPNSGVSSRGMPEHLETGELPLPPTHHWGGGWYRKLLWPPEKHWACPPTYLARQSQKWACEWTSEWVNGWVGGQVVDFAVLPWDALLLSWTGQLVGKGAAPSSSSNGWAPVILLRQERGWVCLDTPLCLSIFCSCPGPSLLKAALVTSIAKVTNTTHCSRK